RHTALAVESIYAPTRLTRAGAEKSSRSESFYHEDDAIRSMLAGRKFQEKSVASTHFSVVPTMRLSMPGRVGGKQRSSITSFVASYRTRPFCRSGLHFADPRRSMI